jgi:signal transduction histidine kinase/CheY-like chemotaxis protein/Fe-S-cluster-containing hydrogenase component 2
MDMANTVHQDAAGRIKVSLDYSQCIACGACLEACKHGARYYEDDTGRFLRDLASGTGISLIVAPSIRNSFPQWRRVLKWLRSLGACGLYDASVGADIGVWAHLKYMERHPGKRLIIQPCVAIAAYCERKRHELLDHLSPVKSPTACLAVYMKKHLGVLTPIASLSPCIAKPYEQRALGVFEYSLTFDQLRKHLANNRIELPDESDDFDGRPTGLDSLLPFPGGMRDNLQYYLGRRLRVEVASGRNAFRKLDGYAATDPRLLPDIFEVTNCEDGCTVGTVGVGDPNHHRMAEHAEDAYNIPLKDRRKSLEAYDATLDLADFLRDYTVVPDTVPEISEAAIHTSFLLLNKDDYTQQNFNCGACGSENCRDMARRIALGINIPENCVMKSRNEARRERSRNESFLKLIHEVGDILLSPGQETGYRNSVSQALRAVCELINGEDAISLWKYDATRKRGLCRRVFRWFGKNWSRARAVSRDLPEEWIEELKQGRHVQRFRTSLPGPGVHVFSAETRTALMVPITHRNRFWGFIMLANADNRGFDEKEIFTVQTCGSLIVSSIMEHNLIKNLMEMRRAAESANAAKSEFLSKMSHEIRTPLNVVIGMTALGKTAEGLDRKDHCLGRIEDASRHLLGVINDILDISKINAGKLELATVEFNLEKTLRRAVDILGFQAEEKQQEMILHVDGDIPASLAGDDQRLTQIVMNLLSNAIKFTPERGTIYINASLDGRADDRHVVKVEVIDTGMGVTAEQQARLFTVFEQGNGDISRRFGGTGLGLAISKRLVELMGGEIWVESRPGEGSIFAFTARFQDGAEARGSRVEEAEVAAEEKSALLANNFSNRRILLVEDVKINREIVQAILEPTKLAIDCAENGVEAVRMFCQNPDAYDLIFMDVQMPEMDGYEATQRIRELDVPAASRVPIVAMTANVFREDVEKCLSVGMTDHVGKPLDFDMVLNKLRTYL